MDDSWLTDKAGSPVPLGRKLQDMIAWGKVVRPSKNGPVWYALYFVDIEGKRWLVTDVRCTRRNDESPWRDWVTVDDPSQKSGFRTLGPDDLARYRAKEHWKLEPQAIDARKVNLYTGDYRPASVTE